MSNTLSLIPRANFGNDMAAALISKYGASMTIHFSDANNVIFSCGDLSDKVIRIFKEQLYYSGSEYYDRLLCYIGDAWTSGTTITNSVQFSGNGRTGSGIDTTGYITEAELVMGSNFIIVHFPTNRRQMCIIGKLTNGAFVVGGFVTESSPSYNSNCRFVKTSDIHREGQFLCMYDECRAAGKYVANNAHVIFGTEAEINPDGTLAYFDGLLNVAAHVNARFNESVWISQYRWMYTRSLWAQFATPLMVILGGV